jgi:hypothetical protein
LAFPPSFSLASSLFCSSTVTLNGWVKRPLELSYCPRPPGCGWMVAGLGPYHIMVEKRGTRWTPKEDDLFRRMAQANIRPELIAAKLNRSVHAIKARAYVIGLPLKWFKLKAKGK